MSVMKRTKVSVECFIRSVRGEMSTFIVPNVCNSSNGFHSSARSSVRFWIHLDWVYFVQRKNINWTRLLRSNCTGDWTSTVKTPWRFTEVLRLTLESQYYLSKTYLSFSTSEQTLWLRNEKGGKKRGRKGCLVNEGRRLETFHVGSLR